MPSASTLLTIMWLAFCLVAIWRTKPSITQGFRLLKTNHRKHPIVHEVILPTQVAKIGFELYKERDKHPIPQERPHMSGEFVLIGVFNDYTDEEIAIDLSERHIYRAKIYDLNNGEYWKCRLYKVPKSRFRECVTTVSQPDTDG